MCYSTSTLIYGLWVTTSSLVFAATAHHRSRSPFLALELIARRRQSGSLKASSRVVDVPPEVWEVVKQELLELEMKQAEAEALDALRCEDCEGDDRARSFLQGSLLGEDEFVVEHQWASWGSPPEDCDDCWSKIYEDSEVLPITTERQTALWELLDQSGLALASLEPCPEEPYDNLRDFHSALAITSPFRSPRTSSTEHPRVQAEADHDPEYASAHAVANISAEVFNLPADIERRFASLVNTYNLEVVDRATQDILPSRPRADLKHDSTTQRGKGKGKAKELVEELKFGPAEPRWMLWSTYESCGM